jgi:hypothetical protein
MSTLPGTRSPRRPYRRSRLAAALALTVALGAATAACTTSDSDGAPKGSTKVGDAATVQSTTSKPKAPTTTASNTASTTTSTTAPAATTGRGTPADAAQALYDAWKVGDRAAALNVADATAVDGIWKTAPGDYALYNKCDTAEFGKDTGLGSSTSGCLFRGNSGTIQFSMEQRGDAWVVVEAFFAEP